MVMAMMDERWAMFFASLLGIIPSYGILYLAVSKLERKLNEKDTMISFIIGLFAGIAIVVTHLIFLHDYGLTAVALIASILLALGECLLYYIFVNRRKFKKRDDIIFIGFSFGLGSASTYILFVAGRMFYYEGVQTSMVLGMALFALAVPLIRGTIGLMIARYKLLNRTKFGLALSTALLTLFNMAAFLYLYPRFPYLWPYAIASLIIAIIPFGILYGDLAKAPDINQ